MKFKSLLAVAALVSLFATAARADTIDLTTGTAAWNLLAVPSGAPGAGNVGGAAVVITNPHPAWNATLTQSPYNAEWIGATALGGTEGLAGDYVYETAIAVTPGTYAISALFTSDNMVKSMELNGTPLTLSSQNGIYAYQGVFTVSGTGTVGSQLKLKAVVYNESEVSGQSLQNPTGFILAGEATAVPLPAAAWASFGMLGLLGVARVRKGWR